MIDNIWTPHPATLAYRVIKYLKTLPAGKFVATGPLSEAMGQPSSAVITGMYRAVENGLILREKKNGFYQWALSGKGWEMNTEGGHVDSPAQAAAPQPDPATVSETVDDDTQWGGPSHPPAPAPEPLPVKKITPAPVAARRVKRPSAAAAAVDIDRVHTKVAAEPARDDPFKFNWSSDDVLTVSKAGASVSMTHDEYQDLARFVGVVGVFTL